MNTPRKDSGAEAGAVERRRGDRRSDRREAPETGPEEESWYASAADTLMPADEALADAAEALDADWPGKATGDPDSLVRRARRVPRDAGSALSRIHRTYTAARAAIGVALAAGVGVTSLVGVRPAWPLLLLCLAYALQSVGLWLWPRVGTLASPQEQGRASMRRRRWLATVGVDLLVFGSLHVLASDASLNFAPLLVLPVLMAGVLSSRLVALATAAGATLVLLGGAWSSAGLGAGSASLITQSGLAGLGFFLITLLSGELASRLAREEIAARGSMALARQQAQLNRLMIEEMDDGVLVVDRQLRVRAANPAARSLLSSRGQGPAAPFRLQERAEWSALAEAVQRALAEDHWPEAGAEVVLHFGKGDTRTLRLRVRFTRRRAARAGEAGSEPFCVLLLEDVRTALARLRQEKLAAMGRVSAGIAHEIRNPLAAIAQANALLLEDPLPEAQRRLARMVAENVERLRRIVEDVMEVAPGTAPQRSVIDAKAEVDAAAAEWARTTGVSFGSGGRLRLDLPDQPLRVSFDREHLRRVLVNLLDNAHRHASTAPGAIDVRLAATDERNVLLRVDSDGSPIDQEVERHLFEPFFSTRSRGTGLGLYICRELCERYGASIEYRLRPDGQRNLFLVMMRRDAAA